jgi:hypothetical protein
MVVPSAGVEFHSALLCSCRHRGDVTPRFSQGNKTLGNNFVYCIHAAAHFIV